MLGFEKFYSIPKQTIGSSVNNLVEAALKSYFNLKKTSELYNLVKQCSHDKRIKDCRSALAYLAKTNGDRCYNRRPTETSSTRVLVDIDITSCYERRLQLQSYPIERVIIIDYKIDFVMNDSKTLKGFLSINGEDLISGLWYFRISRKE